MRRRGASRLVAAHCLAVATALLGAGVLAAGAEARSPRCDPLGGARCLFPWPNDYFTRTDPSTATGRRLALTTAMMPRNAQGVPIAPGDYNLSDGFSPGQAIVLKVPGLDTPAALRRTGAARVTNLARSFARRQPAVVIDATTGRRHLIWAELDSTASTPAATALLIHPGRNWREGHRYIVALRRLRDGAGRIIPAGAAFRRYRDRIPTRSASFERRRAHMEQLFATLRAARVPRRDLYLAWDFTVASGRSLSRRMLSIRDRAFRAVGDPNLKDLKVAGRPPAYTIERVEDSPTDAPSVARRVTGTVTVPCFLDRPGCPPGSRFRLGADGLPRRIPGNVYRANFICNIPRSATPQRPARPSLYGHGLFGDAGEVRATNVEQLGDEHDVLVCAADWIGMAEEDILPSAAPALLELSHFPQLPDRLQQGYLDFLFLGRLLLHPKGFAADPAFRRDGRPLVDTRRLFYYGNSQGGIAGGGLTAVAPDFTRSVLYVGAMNYSLLLTRSVDFDEFAQVLYPAYPDQLEHPLILSLIQVLWDRGEPNGYAWHMVRNPYPNTPRHHVLQLMSLGDHQVANVATEVEARTIGSRLRAPTADSGRSAGRHSFYGIPRVRRFPFHGPAALVVWDIGPLRPGGCPDPDDQGQCGTPVPPTTNLPPRIGVDPHDLVIESEARVRRQIAQWLRLGGRLVNVCGREPCHAAGWTGP